VVGENDGEVRSDDAQSDDEEDDGDGGLQRGRRRRSLVMMTSSVDLEEIDGERGSGEGEKRDL